MKSTVKPVSRPKQQPPSPDKRRVILLSGGIDSAALVAWCGAQCLALTVDYGQRSRVEISAAKAIAEHYGVEHVVLSVPGIFPGSALTDADPDNESACVVPVRNATLLSLAASLASSRGIERVNIGATLTDARDYADCRPGFIEAYNASQRASETPVVVGAPFLEWTKEEVVWLARRLDLPFQLTHSCYSPRHDGAHCGLCASCRERQRAGVEI